MFLSWEHFRIVVIKYSQVLVRLNVSSRLGFQKLRPYEEWFIQTQTLSKLFRKLKTNQFPYLGKRGGGGLVTKVFK